ncbi:hypothetical protein Tco_1559958 [Tanacetum coccineum]
MCQLFTNDPLISQDPKVSEEDAEEKPTEMDESGASKKDGKNDQAARNVPNVTPMDDTIIFEGAYDDEDVGGQDDLNNLETTMNASSIPTTRINKDHLIELIIGDLHSAPLTRKITQEGDSSSGRSKLDRSNARGAFTILTSEGLDTG